VRPATPVGRRRAGNAPDVDDDETLANRVKRDGRAGAQRGGSQTHGAGDASGVDTEPEIPQMRFSEGEEDDDEPGPAAEASLPSSAGSS
jgi:hypothetical protein